MKKPILSLLILILLTVAAAASAQSASDKTDITGVWLADVTTSVGSGSPVFTFVQAGEQLTGKYSGQFGEVPLTGTVTGRDIRFSFRANVQGNDLTFKYSGTLADNGEITGKLDADVLQGTWKAVRQAKK